MAKEYLDYPGLAYVFTKIKALISRAMGTQGVTTAGTGAAYTATVDGITALTAGATFVMIPHETSTSKTATLDVNGLGAKMIRRRVSNSTVTTVTASADNWLYENKPIRVTYDGTYWVADMDRPNASDIYGTVDIANGGTGASSAEAALANLGGAALEYVDTKFIKYLNLDYIKDDEHLVPNGADLNDYTTPGVYRIANTSISASLVNSPAYKSSGGRLIVSATSVAHTGVIQTIVFNSQNGQIYYRIRTEDDSWGSWKREVSFLDIYPVGAIYMSVDSTSPASIFGGSWSQLKDRFLLGAGSTYSNGDTGGAATVTLTLDQIPKHTHDIVMDSNYNSGDFSTDQVAVGQPPKSSDENGKLWENDKPVKSAGGGKSHNNMPPYLVVYMWKRTA